jgi:superfamily II DNA or RNA helicase
MIQLWPHQSLGIADIHNTFRRGHKRVLYSGPPGCGKTNTAAAMVSTAAGKNFDCLFICNRLELMEQTALAFLNFDVPFGLIGGGFTFDPSQRINIASIDTLKRNIRLQRPPRLVIWDECRGLGAAGWTKVFNAFPDAYHVGFDATPIRQDGKSLAEYFTALVCGPVYSELVRLGRLVPFKVFAPSIPDMTGVKTVRGEFDHGATEAIMDKPALTGDIVATFKAHANGRQGLTFAVSRVHSEHLAAQYRAAGIVARHLDGDTDKAERKRIVSAFRRREIQNLCNVALFAAGFDVPGIEIITDAAPTRSISIAVQRWGRGSRAEAGKSHCTLLDHAGNVFRHNVPDKDRQWTLEFTGEKRKKSDSEWSISVRQCPACFAVSPAGSAACRECGSAFPLQPREVDQREGELVAIDDVMEFRRKAEDHARLKACVTLADYEAYGRTKGWKPGAAYHRWKAATALRAKYHTGQRRRG